MWLLPSVGLEIPYRVQISVAMALAALALGIAAALEFRRIKTTINPLTPEKSSALAMRGVYARSRNPIYVADAILLLAWAIYIDNAVALLGIPLFVLYINRFQIAPEERALRSRFGADFDEYCRRVRRWL
jgi:protein-S-isoprenylcysteine O-methyltransferase Ste14